MILLAHKIQIRPTPEQETFLLRSVGCRRFVYNMCLAEWNYAYKHGLRPDRDYLRFYLRLLKEKYTWLNDMSAHILDNAILDLVEGFQRFFKGIAKHPRFKKKGITDSFAIRMMTKFKIIGRTLLIEKMRHSPILMREKVRFDGQHRQVTLSYRAGKWFASILVKMQGNPYVNKSPDENQVGVDIGIKELATLSDGTVFPANQPLKLKLKKLAKLQRQLAKKDKGSNRRKKLQRKIQKLHYYIVCKRQAVLHELTDHLTRNYKRIVIEDLNVAGMVKNHKLARAISDVGLGEFRRQMEYKSNLRECELVIADRFFPSSKMCSRCGSTKKDLTLADREYNCSCGLSIDRDLNASINLLNYEV